MPIESITDYLNIEPRYNDGYTQREFVGYFVHKMAITLRDLTKFEDLLSTLLESGVKDPAASCGALGIVPQLEL